MSDGNPDSYVVIARRYRPQAFDELIGQEHVRRAIVGAIETGRVGHAYLFSGARGVGKTSAARILAKALNCVHGPTTTPCNVCDNCRAISAGEDVDVLEIDGASNRGVDEIRQLRQTVAVRPSRARFKIYIIDEVHMLTREAFNALLKTLEEPPAHVKFIFCTTEPEKVPVTIQSRCQRFDFAGIRSASIVDRLAQICRSEGVEAESEALAIIARAAAGSLRDSQSLLEQVLSGGGERLLAADVHALLGSAGSERIERIMAAIGAHDPATVLTELDAAVAEGVDVGQMLEQVLGYLRDAMAAAVGCSGDALISTARAQHEQVADFARQLGVENILAMIQIVDQTLSRLRLTTHVRTLAEIALVRLARLSDLDELSGVIAQLRSGTAASGTGSGATSSAGAKSDDPAKKKESAKPASGSPDNPSTDDASHREAPPRSVNSLTSENVEGAWRAALSRFTDLISENAALAERVACIDGRRLAVTFAQKYNSCKLFCQRPENAAKLEAALASIVGAAVRIDFELAGGEPADAAPAPRPAPLRQKMSEKSQHPLVRRATELFGARMVRIEEKPD
ncbi:MAG: DNA polymerase III subunit gamma/tau [Pirellulales bacterium]